MGLKRLRECEVPITGGDNLGTKTWNSRDSVFEELPIRFLRTSV